MITTLLAQADLGSIPATFLKWFVVSVVAFVLVACAIAGAFMAWLSYRLEKKSKKEVQKVEMHPQPMEFTKTPRRFNPELAKQQKEEVDRRLGEHDVEIDSIWNTLRAEDEATRKELRDYVADTNLSLGRIEGKLGTLPKEN